MPIQEKVTSEFVIIVNRFKNKLFQFKKIFKLTYIFQLLERREQQMDSRSQNAVIAELYNEMRKYMEKGTDLMPVFLKMLESFRFVIIIIS
jgi:hypothetical protein